MDNYERNMSRRNKPFFLIIKLNNKCYNIHNNNIIIIFYYIFKI